MARRGWSARALLPLLIALLGLPILVQPTRAGLADCDIADATYSWWTHPIASVGGDRAVHVGTIDSTGTVRHYRDCAGTELGHGVADDHSAASVVAVSGRPLFTIQPGHNERTTLEYQVGARTGSIPLPGPVSYAQVLTKGAWIVVLTRVGGCAWYALRSDDWATTWAPPVVLVDDCAAGGLLYVTTRRHQTQNGVYRLAIYGHPKESSWPGIGYGLLDLGTGAITTPGKVEIANIRTGVGLPLGRDRLAAAVPVEPGTVTRLFDVGQVDGDPLIAYASGPTLGSLRYATARFDRATSAWVRSKTLPLAGAPFWDRSGYVGGLAISDAGSVVVAREAAGRWSVEQYARRPSGWVRVATLATASTPLVRPYAVRFGSSVLIQQVDHYVDYRSYRTAIRELPLVTP